MMYTGGASGADLMWVTYCKDYVIICSFKGHKPKISTRKEKFSISQFTTNELKTADFHLTNANKFLKRSLVLKKKALWIEKRVLAKNEATTLLPVSPVSLCLLFDPQRREKPVRRLRKGRK